MRSSQVDKECKLEEEKERWRGRSHKKKASGGGTTMGSCIKASTNDRIVRHPHRWPHQQHASDEAVSANSMLESLSAPDKPQHSDLRGTN